jgi:hypothetical protein
VRFGRHRFGEAQPAPQSGRPSTVLVSSLSRWFENDSQDGRSGAVQRLLVTDGASVVAYTVSFARPRSRTRHHWRTSTTGLPAAPPRRRSGDVPRCPGSPFHPVARRAGNPMTIPVTEDHRTDPTTRTGSASSQGRSTSGCAVNCSGSRRGFSRWRTPTGLSRRSVGGKEQSPSPSSSRGRDAGDGPSDRTRGSPLPPR